MKIHPLVFVALVVSVVLFAAANLVSRERANAMLDEDRAQLELSSMALDACNAGWPRPVIAPQLTRAPCPFGMRELDGGFCIEANWITTWGVADSCGPGFRTESNVDEKGAHLSCRPNVAPTDPRWPRGGGLEMDAYECRARPACEFKSVNLWTAPVDGGVP